MKRIGYGRNKSGWYFFIPGFFPINGYAWSGHDDKGVVWSSGRKLFRTRLYLLRNSFLPTQRFFFRRFIAKARKDGWIK
jgi:hypothetical protein